MYMIFNEPQNAKPHVKIARGIAEDLLSGAPNDDLRKRDMALAKQLVGRLELQLGQPLDALDQFNAALRELEDLPGQTRFVAMIYAQRARAQMTLKRYDASLDSYSTAKGLFEELANAKANF